jgi:phage terminase small subunit
MAKLKNLKHEKFILEYCIDLNASRAYKAVYGDVKGADANASRLIKTDKVQKRLRELQEKKEAKAEIKSFDVIKEIERIASARMVDVFHLDDGFLTIRNLSDIPEECQSAIESIESISLGGDKGVVMKIKFHSKIKALELLARHFGMFNDNLNITAKPKTIEDLLNSAKG